MMNKDFFLIDTPNEVNETLYEVCKNHNKTYLR